MKEKFISCSLFALSLTVVTMAHGGEFWVDRNRPDDSGDGLSRANAKRTLQAGVDLLGDGDVLWVCPGDYDEGGGAVVTVNMQTNRVNILDKSNVTIKSTDGKSVTRIIGKHSATSNGTGSDAVRCMFANGGSGGIRIEGFTFLNGASGAGGVASSITSGGGFYGRNVSGSHYEANVISDCDFIGCQAYFGGAASYATLVRCRVMSCSADLHGAAVYLGAMLHCQVNQNYGRMSILREVDCCNCTIADNYAGDGVTGGPVYNSKLANCVVIHNGGESVGYGDNSIVARYGVFTKDNGKDFKSKYNCQCTPAFEEQFVAPLYDDYRPLASRDVATYGSAEELSGFGYVGAADLYLDLNGSTVPRAGTIAAGCCQFAVTPEGGVMKMADASGYTTRGLTPMTGGLYAFAEHWPTQHLVQGVSTETIRVGSFAIGGSTVYPLVDDSVWIMPPKTGSVSVKVNRSTNIRYVNKSIGKDNDASYDGKTPVKPYRTIQRGVDDNPEIVIVAPGDYDEGCRKVSGGGDTSNRLVIASTARSGMRIVGAGAACTTIRGKAATYDEAGDNPGCGPDAIRCVFAAQSCCIQGFSLADGHVVAGNTDPSTSGGGVFGGYSQIVRVHDCVITNCVAVRGDAIHGGDCRRCKIVNCGTGRGAPSRYATFAFCSFSGLKCSATSRFADDFAAYNCTYLGKSAEYGMFGDSSTTRYNCIIARSREVKASLPLQGCLLYDCSDVKAVSGFVNGDPFFIDEEIGDCRVMSCSEAVGVGVVYDNATLYMVGDIEGNPIRFVNAKPTAGAYQASTPGIRVSASSKYGSQNWSGSRELVPGETITVSVTDDVARHCTGFNVNGEDCLSEPAVWTVQVPGVLKGDEVFNVIPIWSTNWYVNANSDPAKGSVGDDANNGFTPATAKRTLAAILSSANVLEGDCVHAAPGVYADGQMEQKYAARDSGKMTTPVRACVKRGVTLVGDEGAEKTFIVGARNSQSRFENVTSGMRCLNVAGGAKVVGFTLTGGSTPYSPSSGESEPFLGGGVVGPVPAANPMPLVCDCIISNNWACRGGGAFGTVLVNCKLLENYGTETGVAAMASKLVNCLVDRNYSVTFDGQSLIRYPYGIYGCTITDRNVAKGTTTPIKWHISSWADCGKLPIANSIIMGSLQAGVAHTLYNCLVNCDAAELGIRTAWNAGTKAIRLSEMMLEEDSFLPTLSSPALNAGSAEYVVPAFDGGMTLDGVQRIYHGSIDIGCREYDYRPLFAATIGGGVRVDYASSGVVLDNGAVRLSDGETIGGCWPASSGKARYVVPTLASGSGVLTGVLEGQENQFYRHVQTSNEQDTLTFRLRNTAVDFSFAFNGEGAGFLSDFSQLVPGMALFIR